MYQAGRSPLLSGMRTLAAVLAALILAGCGGTAHGSGRTGPKPRAAASHVDQVDAYKACGRYAITHAGATGFDSLGSKFTRRSWGYDVGLKFSTERGSAGALCEVDNSGKVFDWVG